MNSTTKDREFVDEIGSEAALKEIALKQKIVAHHNKWIIKREFEVGKLIYQRNLKDSEERKLAANWEGPYRIRMKTRTVAYCLDDLIKGLLPITWNTEKL